MRIRGSGKYSSKSGVNENDYTTWEPQDLLHIGNNDYYLQTENYIEPKYNNGTLTNSGHGMRIDLKNGSIVSYDGLTLQGGGLSNTGENKDNNNNFPIWQSDNSNPFIYLSNQLFKANATVRKTVNVANNLENVWLRVGDEEHTD